MEAMTISQVSRSFGISTRMLRYYEQQGLIQSFRRQDYAYRMYNEIALSRLRQIMILRKLRVSVKHIRVILQKPDSVAAIKIFRQNISSLDDEIAALSTIRTILCRLVDELKKTADIDIRCFIPEDDAILAAIESLSPTSINFKEDKTMDKLKKADEELSKLRDVRIIYLPPASVAAAHYIGDEPEDRVISMINGFVRETGLCKIKPDIRQYGFNHPNPSNETGYHGYEIWVTIPDDMDVPPPFVKKHFAGGLYAAHMIAMGNFNEWEWIVNWVNNSDKYEFAGDFKDQEHMCGLLEEQLNYVNHVSKDSDPENMQLDLLVPIREHITQ